MWFFGGIWPKTQTAWVFMLAVTGMPESSYLILGFREPKLSTLLCHRFLVWPWENYFWFLCVGVVPLHKKYYRRLNLEMLQTEIMVMGSRYQIVRGCVNTVGGFEYIYFLKGSMRYTFKSCFDWALQETFPILCRNPGVGDFLQLWTTWKISLLLFELKTDCGAISPFPKMNKHEQMPVRLRSLLCWRRRMWTLERSGVILGKQLWSEP